MEENDELLFDTLWDSYAKCLHRYAWAILKDGALEEEAVQETFLIALRHIAVVREHPNPGGWLMNTLKNVILQKVEAEVRQSRCFPAQIDQEDVGLGEILPANTSTGDRRILTLYYHYGYSIAELSTLLGVSEAKCKIDLYRARKRLKKALTENEHERGPVPRKWMGRRGGQDVPEK